MLARISAPVVSFSLSLHRSRSGERIYKRVRCVRCVSNINNYIHILTLQLEEHTFAPAQNCSSHAICRRVSTPPPPQNSRGNHEVHFARRSLFISLITKKISMNNFLCTQIEPERKKTTKRKTQQHQSHLEKKGKDDCNIQMGCVWAHAEQNFYELNFYASI